MWWAAIPKEQWPENLERDIAPLWDALYGDRQQELVVIGKGLDENAVRALLDDCLLRDNEMSGGPEAWAQFEDPFADEEGDTS